MKKNQHPIKRVAIIGSVELTLKVAQAFFKNENGIKVVGLLKIAAANRRQISGEAALDIWCEHNSIEYFCCNDVNGIEAYRFLSKIKPDISFFVGLSQLVSKDVAEIAINGGVGFHPTMLPKGRGRSPVPWLILTDTPGAASFFRIEPNVDAGPIIAMEAFQVASSDYASDLLKKIYVAAEKALEQLIPKLASGGWDEIPQNEAEATYFGVRRPVDGQIDWSNSSNDIAKLIQATSKPYPGAFTFYKEQKITIWEAQDAGNLNMTGVVGRILRVDRNQATVQTGQGHLLIKSYDPKEFLFKEGQKLTMETGES